MNDAKTSSTIEVLSLLPLPTILIDAQGHISTASDSYWQLVGGERMSMYRNELEVTLAKIANKEPPNGVQHFHSPQGTWQLYWQRHPAAAFTIVMIVTEQVADFATGYMPPEEGPTTVSVGSSRELPGHKQTIALLGRAISACAAADTSLALTRLRANLNDSSASLNTTDHEVWRNLGRRLRGICRVSDLVGATEEGDFLIILLGANLQDAKTVTHRVLGQLNSWLRQNALDNISLATGFATWEPNCESTEPLLLMAQAKENLAQAAG